MSTVNKESVQKVPAKRITASSSGNLAKMVKKKSGTTASKVKASAAGFDDYSWFLYTGKPNLVRYAKEDLFVTLKKGALFGVRYAEDGVEKQLVVADPKLGLDKVIKLDSIKEELLFRNHVRIDRNKAKRLYEASVGTTQSKQGPELAPTSQKIAQALQQKGFKIAPEYCENYGEVKNAYVGNLSLKETCKIVESFGVPKEAGQYRNHVNYKDTSSESSNDLIQVSPIAGKTLVTLAW